MVAFTGLHALEPCVGTGVGVGVFRETSIVEPSQPGLENVIIIRSLPSEAVYVWWNVKIMVLVELAGSRTVEVGRML
jgi:hypothetical protein